MTRQKIDELLEYVKNRIEILTDKKKDHEMMILHIDDCLDRLYKHEAELLNEKCD
jgi:hypothetical protein